MAAGRNARVRRLYHSVCRILATVSAPTLFAGRQEEHPACKQLSDEVLVWLSV